MIHFRTSSDRNIWWLGIYRPFYSQTILAGSLNFNWDMLFGSAQAMWWLHSIVPLIATTGMYNMLNMEISSANHSCQLGSFGLLY